MEEPPGPISPSSPPATSAAEGIPGGGGDGGGAEGGEAGGFSAESESLWPSLFGEPELQPMWSPPREFGVGHEFAAPEAEAEVDDAGGPWDGAPWRSTGVVPGENAATIPAPTPGSAAGFPELELAASNPASEAEAASPGAVLEVRPLEGVPDSSSPVPPCSPAPVDEGALEPVAGSEPTPSPAVASPAENSGEQVLDCTINSVPSPLPPPSLDNADSEAEEAPKDRCAIKKTSSGAMVDTGLDAKGGHEDNAGCHSMPDVITLVGRSPWTSPRLTTMKDKTNAALPERKVGVAKASKRCVGKSGQASTSEGNQLLVSTGSLKESAVSGVKPFDLPNGVEWQGSQESFAMKSSSANESQVSGQGNGVVFALPVSSERSMEDEVVSVYSAGSTRPVSKVLVSEMPLELEETSCQPLKAKRVRISLGKCLSNIERAENNSGAICESPVVTMASSPENKPNVMLDGQSRDSEMVDLDDSCFFTGEAVPDDEAKQRWPHRYRSNHRPLKKDKGGNTQTFSKFSEATFNVKCHYLQASICGSILCIGDCAFIKGPEGKPNYIGRLLEFFETTAGEYYFSVQWFFRAEDTVMHDQALPHDQRRLFYSELKDDNLLDCIISKVTVVQVSPSDSEKS